MSLLLLLVAVALAAPHAPAAQRPAPVIERPIALELGEGATKKGGFLYPFFPIRSDDTGEAEKGLLRGLRDRPWLRVVASEGEVAVVVRHGRRTMTSERHSRDRKKTTRTYKYSVAAVVATRDERNDVEAEALVTDSYTAGSGHMFPTGTEDRTAYRRAGEQLANEVRAWILGRIATLRPDGPDAGFEHKAVTRWLVKGDGLEVTAVAPGSPAERAGLRVGDRIRRIDGEGGTRQMDERARTWRLEETGTEVALEIERQRTRQVIAVTLAAKAHPARRPALTAPSAVSWIQ